MTITELMSVLDAAWGYIYSGEDHRQETFTAWREAYRGVFGGNPSSLMLPSRHNHDNKGYSEEKCMQCGWIMGQKPLNCQNDNTPHVFPSQRGIK